MQQILTKALKANDLQIDIWRCEAKGMPHEYGCVISSDSGVPQTTVKTNECPKMAMTEALESFIQQNL